VRIAGEDEKRVQTVMQDEPRVVWFLYTGTFTQGSSDRNILAKVWWLSVGMICKHLRLYCYS